MGMLSFDLHPAAIVLTLLVMALTYIGVKVGRYARRTIRNNRALEAFPSADKHWLYGSQPEGNFKRKGVSPFVENQISRVTRHSRAFRTWIGPFEASLVLVHPETIKAALKASDSKSWVYKQSLQPWLGEGLLIASNKKWLRSRRLLTPAFHFDILKSYVDVFNEAAEVFMTKLAVLAESGKPLDVFDNVGLLTLDVILRCAFTYETDCQTTGTRHPYIVAVYNLGRLWLRRTRQRSVLTTLFPVLYWLSADGREFMRCCKLVHDEADTIITRRRKILEEEGESAFQGKKYLDFLDILLTAKDEDGNGLEPKDLRAEVDTFLFEGHDTTSSALAWTLYCLATHPQIQSKVQEEIDEVMNSLDSNRLTWSSLSGLRYTTQVLKESMRLYPPVPIIARCLSNPLVVDGHTIQTGTTINIPIFALHHNPKVWGDDHREFRPERFDVAEIGSLDPFAFTPFSAGPRNCIGQNFAMSEEKVLLARIFHRFTFSLADDNYKALPCLCIVLRSQEEIRLTVKLRE